MEVWKLISYYDGQITDILPWHISDSPEVKALGYAIKKGTQLLYRYAQHLYLWTDIDNQPEDVLDLMAAELRTQYYKQDLDIEAKRRLVKGTFAWYMTAGTPEAVEELITAIFGEGEVKEWFEYDGKPYCFKVITSAIMTPDINDFFTMMIQRVKNTRSHLDAVEIKRRTDQTIFAGVGQFTSYKPSTIVGGYKEKREINQNIFAGTEQFVNYKPAIITGGYDERRKTRQDIFVGINQFVDYKPAAIIDGYAEKRETVNIKHTGIGQYSQTHQSTILETLNFRSQINQKSKVSIAGVENIKTPAITNDLE